MEIGGMVSPNSGADPAKASSDVLRLTIDLFQDEDATARFDGSDLMPSQVGAGSFWSELTNWIDGQETAAEALAKVESSWP
jgi:alpha-glucoside transport system substrate-binding protein